MFRNYGWLFLALCGIAFSIFMIFVGLRTPEKQPILFEPPHPPYAHYVVGQGIVESVYKNITIGAPFSELIKEIHVKVGDVVQKDAPLFTLDTRQIKADLAEAQAAQKVAEAEFLNQKKQFSFYEKLSNRAAVSEKDYEATFYAYQKAQAQLKQAQATVQSHLIRLERATVKAPIAGEILQVNIRVGEYANVNSTTQFIIMGDTNYYHIRVEIDEEDAWRVILGAPAMAFVRGNSSIAIPLTYAYKEPYIVPKVSLTGLNQERVDTRVLQVVYAFEKKEYPIYYGQLLDVYLEAKPSEAL